MTFANPFAWALLALVVIPVVLYLLPMPRRRAVQASLLLWQKMLQERPATQSWRWLRTLGSFVLAAGILVLLALAAGRPVFSPAAGEGQTAVIVLDTSASMKAPAAAGSSTTRFERARGIAASLVTALPSGRRAAIVAADATPRVISGLSDHRDIALRKLRTLRASDGRGDLASAVRVALELAAGESNADVYVVSDGGGDLSDVSLAGAKVQYLRVGTSLPNVGIVACKARRAFENPGKFEALVRVRNASSATETVTLKVRMNDNVIDTRSLELAPGGEAVPLLTGKVAGSGRLKVSIEPHDAFPADDEAFVNLGSPVNPQVIYVSDVPDRFLLSALTANRSIDSYLKSLDDYRKEVEGKMTLDVYVFGGVLPVDLPPGNLLIIMPPNATSFFRLSDDAASPKLTGWKHEHPVFKDVVLKDVYIPYAKPLKPTGDAEVLMDSDAGPLMVAYSTPERRVIAMGFDPGSTSLSFRVAFPVLLENAFTWLNRGSSSAAPAEANLADPRESDLTVPAELAFADAKVAGREARGGGLGEFWLLAAFAAVGLVALEWYLYHHRVTV